ncbi:MAG: hypothetical protein IH859_10065 [Chloroflexi bacterium]|nr:hypothetical protein [Chloroflexota bacterium]
MKPASNIVDFGLYLAYFPKLIAGPIERPGKFVKQLNENKSVANLAISRSLGIIFIGLLRALVFAKILIIFLPVDVFSDPLSFPNGELILWIFTYGVILYNQFAGYSNIVRGVSGLFGITLSRNFAQPIFSKDFSDLWTRWHISLSQWLRDYIYLPISRSLIRRNPSRKNVANRIIPPMATMLVSGIWHGGNLHLLVWGAIMGAYMVGEQLLVMFVSIDPSRSIPIWRKVLTTTVIMALAIFAMIPFQLDLLSSKFYLYGIIMVNNWAVPPLIPIYFIAMMFGFDYLQYRTDNELVMLKTPRWMQSVMIALLILTILIVDNLQSSYLPFVYP